MKHVRAAPVATSTPLQDASSLPDLSHQRPAQLEAAEVARKARRAQHQREVKAAMSEQQAVAARTADASAHKKSRSVRHKVSPAIAGYSALSMTVMAALLGSSPAAAAAAAAQPSQQPIGPQPNATAASGLMPPTTLPQPIAPLPPLPAVPNMTSVNPDQSIIHDPSHAPADPNMTGSTQGSMQPPPYQLRFLTESLQSHKASHGFT